MSENQISTMMGNLVTNQRFFSKLDKVNRQWILENPQEFIALSIEAVKKRAKTFSIWKTIQIGTGPKNADELCRAIKDHNNCISDWTNDVIRRPDFKVSSEKSEIDLVAVSVAELGFQDGATRKEIYERAISLGLDIVPAEVGPQLRLQYQDQPKREWLIIAMEPIKDSDGDPHVFNVYHDGDGLWLRAVYGLPGSVWSPDSRWVFALRK